MPDLIIPLRSISRSRSCRHLSVCSVCQIKRSRRGGRDDIRGIASRVVYYVYFLTNASATVLYTGVTNDLKRRVREHKEGTFPGFTKKYNVRRLVYFEAYDDIRDAIAREKKLKRWRRSWKIDLIRAQNPSFRDLFVEL